MDSSQQIDDSVLESSVDTSLKTTESTSKVTLIGGLLAGIGASACCVGPFLLMSLGISGSWIGNLSAMDTYRPYLIGLTLVFMGLAFRKLYLVPQHCEVDTPCASPNYVKKQRIIFWVISVFVLSMITFPYYAPYFLD